MKALEIEFAGGFDIGQFLDRHEDLAVDQYLASVGLPAQPRREVDDRADGRIIEPALEPNAPHGGKAMRNAHAEAELVAVFAPLQRELADRIAHFDRHANRAKRGVQTRQRIVEKDHKAVARVFVERAFVFVNERTETSVIFAQDAHHFLGLRALGKGGEAAQIAKYDADVAPVAFKNLLVARRK